MPQIQTINRNAQYRILWNRNDTKQRESIKMPYIYITLTWLVEWEDFITFRKKGDIIWTPKTIKLGDSQ
jgi:hypothetical protein